jgi:hypothetical protein
MAKSRKIEMSLDDNSTGRLSNEQVCDASLKNALRDLRDDLDRRDNDLEAALQRAAAAIRLTEGAPEYFDKSSIGEWLEELRADVEATIEGAVKERAWRVKRTWAVFRQATSR